MLEGKVKIYHSKKETFREIPKEMSMITARYVRLKKGGLRHNLTILPLFASIVLHKSQGKEC